MGPASSGSSSESDEEAAGSWSSYEPSQSHQPHDVDETFRDLRTFVQQQHYDEATGRSSSDEPSQSYQPPPRDVGEILRGFEELFQNDVDLLVLQSKWSELRGEKESVDRFLQEVCDGDVKHIFGAQLSVPMLVVFLCARDFLSDDEVSMFLARGVDFWAAPEGITITPIFMASLLLESDLVRYLLRETTPSCDSVVELFRQVSLAVAPVFACGAIQHLLEMHPEMAVPIARLSARLPERPDRESKMARYMPNFVTTLEELITRSDSFFGDEHDPFTYFHLLYRKNRWNMTFFDVFWDMVKKGAEVNWADFEDVGKQSMNTGDGFWCHMLYLESDAQEFTTSVFNLLRHSLSKRYFEFPEVFMRDIFEQRERSPLLASVDDWGNSLVHLLLANENILSDSAVSLQGFTEKVLARIARQGENMETWRFALQQRNFAGETALSLAVSSPNLAVCTQLIEALNVKPCAHDVASLLESQLTQDDPGDSLVDFEKLWSLFTKPFDKDELQCLLERTLHYCIVNATTPRCAVAAELIGRYGVSVDVVIDADKKRTPLMIAVILHHEECVRELLQLGASRELQDADGYTVVNYAQDPKMLEILNLTSETGITPLELEESDIHDDNIFVLREYIEDWFSRSKRLIESTEGHWKYYGELQIMEITDMSNTHSAAFPAMCDSIISEVRSTILNHLSTAADTNDADAANAAFKLLYFCDPAVVVSLLDRNYLLRILIQCVRNSHAMRTELHGWIEIVNHFIFWTYQARLPLAYYAPLPRAVMEFFPDISSEGVLSFAEVVILVDAPEIFAVMLDCRPPRQLDFDGLVQCLFKYGSSPKMCKYLFSTWRKYRANTDLKARALIFALEQLVVSPAEWTDDDFKWVLTELCNGDPNFPFGRTPLFRLILDQNLRDDDKASMIARLIRAGAHVNKTMEEHSVLSLAVTHSSEEVVRSILDHSSDLEIDLMLGEKKETALHLAVRQSKISVAKLLLQHNAKPDIADVMGDTPHTIASKMKGKDAKHIINVLETHIKRWRRNPPTSSKAGSGAAMDEDEAHAAKERADKAMADLLREEELESSIAPAPAPAPSASGKKKKGKKGPTAAPRRDQDFATSTRSDKAETDTEADTDEDLETSPERCATVDGESSSPTIVEPEPSLLQCESSGGAIPDCVQGEEKEQEQERAMPASPREETDWEQETAIICLRDPMSCSNMEELDHLALCIGTFGHLVSEEELQRASEAEKTLRSQLHGLDVMDEDMRAAQAVADAADATEEARARSEAAGVAPRADDGPEWESQKGMRRAAEEASKASTTDAAKRNAQRGYAREDSLINVAYLDRLRLLEKKFMETHSEKQRTGTRNRYEKFKQALNAAQAQEQKFFECKRALEESSAADADMHAAAFEQARRAMDYRLDRLEREKKGGAPVPGSPADEELLKKHQIEGGKLGSRGARKLDASRNDRSSLRSGDAGDHRLVPSNGAASAEPSFGRSAMPNDWQAQDEGDMEMRLRTYHNLCSVFIDKHEMADQRAKEQAAYYEQLVYWNIPSREMYTHFFQVPFDKLDGRLAKLNRVNRKILESDHQQAARVRTEQQPQMMDHQNYPPLSARTPPPGVDSQVPMMASFHQPQAPQASAEQQPQKLFSQFSTDQQVQRARTWFCQLQPDQQVHQFWLILSTFPPEKAERLHMRFSQYSPDVLLGEVHTYLLERSPDHLVQRWQHHHHHHHQQQQQQQTVHYHPQAALEPQQQMHAQSASQTHFSQQHAEQQPPQPAQMRAQFLPQAHPEQEPAALYTQFPSEPSMHPQFLPAQSEAHTPSMYSWPFPPQPQRQLHEHQLQRPGPQAPMQMQAQVTQQRLEPQMHAQGFQQRLEPQMQMHAPGTHQRLEPQMQAQMHAQGTHQRSETQAQFGARDGRLPQPRVQAPRVHVSEDAAAALPSDLNTFPPLGSDAPSPAPALSAAADHFVPSPQPQ